MRAYRFTVALVVWVAGAGLAFGADNPPADPDAVRELMRTYQGGSAPDLPLMIQHGDGYLRALGAPGDASFGTRRPMQKTDAPEEIAKAFLEDHGAAFGLRSGAIGFEVERFQEADGRQYVRLKQDYGGIPVFGAEATVQVTPEGRVRNVLTGLFRDTRPLDTGGLSTSPVIDAESAREAAYAHVLSMYDGGAPTVAEGPDLKVYVPSIVGNEGSTKLTWHFVIASEEGAEPMFAERVFVDAHTGGIALGYNLICGLADREIYDANNSPDPVLVRSEGDPPTGVEEVDEGYDLVGEARDYFDDFHGRLGFDQDGVLPLRAWLRFCDGFGECPMNNAFWNPIDQVMGFGDGWATRDIVGHEHAHGVSSFEADLVYLNESGAIEEMFADAWGEFIDITFSEDEEIELLPEDGGRRWLIGDELAVGAIRSMSNPPSFESFFGGPNPDRYNHPNFYRGPLDNGGVHHNSGVGNKLVYLLTDGDDFNGFTVEGMGVQQVSELLYEVNTNLLFSTAQYPDLYPALMMAGGNLGFSSAELNNVEAAALAVEIADASVIRPLRHFRATSRQDHPDVVLTWRNPVDFQFPNFQGVTLVRNSEGFPEGPADGEVIFEGDAEQFRDTGTALGAEYFYGVFADMGMEDDGDGQSAFARVTAGTETSGYMTEVFSEERPLDLSYSQITFYPVGDPTLAIDSGRPQDYTNYSNYQAEYRGNVFELPVDRPGSVPIRVEDDGFVNFHDLLGGPPIPLFGAFHDDLALAANGYILSASSLYAADAMYRPHDTVDRFRPENFPSMASHFEVPRISFLFSDVSSTTSGEMWGKRTNDRIAITFENMTEMGQSYPQGANTVQVELFFSGHIRFTYLEVNAVSAVVGLSDGRGSPGFIDPETNEFEMAEPVSGAGLTDFTELPPPGLVRLDPIPVQFVEEGETVSFSVTARGPTTPELSASNLPDGAVFTPEPGGRGTFTWDTSIGDGGSHSVRICATSQGESACQDVLVMVMSVTQRPVISNLRIEPQFPAENRPLTAEYDYADPQGLAESGSTILWRRNSAVVNNLINRRSVGAAQVRDGDRWYVTVTPRNVLGITGEPQASRTVVIGQGLVGDVNGDGQVNAADVQLVIRGALGLSIFPFTLDDVDLNNDNVVNAQDIQIVVNAALGIR